MHPLHFRKLVEDTLAAMGPPYDSPSAVELLLLTAAQESKLGEYLWQAKRDGSPSGPAIGPYQFEPATHDDLWDWIERQPNKLIRAWVRWLVGADQEHGGIPETPIDMVKVIGLERLAFDLRYATAICRLNYWRKPGALPASDDIEGLAAYWHKYHCAGCKGQPADAIRNYRRLVLRQKEES